MLPEQIRTYLDKPGSSGVTVRRQLGVFALYLLIAIAYTYPLAFNLSTHIPDKHPTLTLESDAALQTWYPWWVRKALLSFEETVLHSDWVYYPVGMEMTMQPAMFLHGAMTVPLFWLDITTANNTVIIVSFALSGLAAFLLGMYVTRSYRAALFCGFIYAFSPYKLQHLEGHIQLMATETLPLVALSLIRLLDKPSRRHLVWAGIWLGVTVYTDYYYFAYALLLYGFVVLYRLVTDRDRQGVLRRSILAGLIAFAVAAPLLIPALVSASQSDYAIASGHEKHKADLLSPIVPSQRQLFARPLQPFLAKYINMERVDGIEHSIYVGWPLLILCFASLGKIRSGRGAPLLFVLIAGLFLVFALGPSLRVNGYDAIEGWRIPMPGWILKELPVFEGARAPSRIFIVSVIGFAVWGACGLRRILASSRTWGVPSEYLAAGIVAFTAIEYIIPTGMSELRRPAWVDIVANDPEPGIVVRVPLIPIVPAFWQPITDRKELNATLGRTDQDLSAYYWRHEALQFLTMPHYATWMPDERDAQLVVDLLNIRYAVLDLDAYDERRLEQATNILISAYGMEEVHRDSTAALFRLPREHRALRSMRFRTSDKPADLYLPFGWSNRKPFETNLVAWIVRERAVIALPGIQPGDYILNLDLRVLSSRDLNVSVQINGTHAGAFSLRPDEDRISIPLSGDSVESERNNLITLVPEQELGFPHNTGLGIVPSHGVPIEIKSGGFFTSSVGTAEIRVGGRAASTMKRGWLIVVVDATGEFEVRHFESLVEDSKVADLENYLKSVPRSSTVAIAVRTINHLREGNLGEALRWVGLPEDIQLNPLHGFALLGGTDGRTPVLDTGAALARIGTKDSRVLKEGAVGLLGLELVRR